jgi:hypothetical protein
MRLITILLVVLVLCAVSSEAWLFKENEYVKLFQSFIARFKRAYSTSAFSKKLLQFKKNLDLITNVNKNKRKFTLGVNDFADLSEAEFRTRLGAVAPKTKAALIEASSGFEAQAYTEMSQEALNEAFAEGLDWEKDGKTMPIRDQSSCGSCWSVRRVFFFSLPGNLWNDVTMVLRCSHSPFFLCSSSFFVCSLPSRHLLWPSQLAILLSSRLSRRSRPRA